jgi:hypothetical protein
MKLVFNSTIFWRHFQMSKYLFLIILQGLMNYGTYFRYKPDAFTSYQKCFATICMIAYEVPGDRIDKYLRMTEATYLDAMYKFCLSCYCSVRLGLLERANRCRHFPAAIYQQGKKILWNDLQHILHWDYLICAMGIREENLRL